MTQCSETVTNFAVCHCCKHKQKNVLLSSTQNRTY